MSIGEEVTIKNGLEVIYESKYYCVINKPSGLLSVPGRGPDKQDCIVNRFKNHFPQSIHQPAVHRLDMETSGLMVLAKSQIAHSELSRQFQEGLVHKKYLAILDGLLERSKGRVELSFRLDPDNRPYQMHDPIHGDLGITDWKTLDQFENTTKVEFTPQTGRTHQLRLHASHPLGLNTPIVGDCLYGKGKKLNELKLQASFLSFLEVDDSTQTKRQRRHARKNQLNTTTQATRVSFEIDPIF